MLRPIEPLLRLPFRGGRPVFSALRSGSTATAPAPPAPGGVTGTPPGFPPAPYGDSTPTSLAGAANVNWVRRVVATVNNILQGRLNVVLPVTLAPSVGFTTVIDARISAYCALLFSPLTANAAAEIGNGTLYVYSQTNGSATLAHTNSAQDDRTFNMVIIG